jgi:hypothetical protein
MGLTPREAASDACPGKSAGFAEYDDAPLTSNVSLHQVLSSRQRSVQTPFSFFNVHAEHTL